jgi:hypothetical protein
VEKYDVYKYLKFALIHLKNSTALNFISYRTYYDAWALQNKIIFFFYYNARSFPLYFKWHHIEMIHNKRLDFVIVFATESLSLQQYEGKNV